MRLLSRVYTDGNTPSKVTWRTKLLGRPFADVSIVLAELYETEIHGQIIMTDTDMDYDRSFT